MSEIITENLVLLDQNLGSSAEDVIRALAERITEAGRATESESLFADAWAREQKNGTGVPGGIAIPHCRSESVLEPTLAMARLSEPVDFGAKDGPADIVFFIAAPAGADKAHLKLLSALARSLVKKDFTAALREAQTPREIVELVDAAIAPKAAPAESDSAPAAESVATAGDPAAGPAVAPVDAPRKIVAVTACATGIAHTYMAADSLTQAAKDMGVDIAVETQGSAGAKPLNPQTIQDADAVIFAVDVDVREKSRFAGKPVINVPVKAGIEEPQELIEKALAAASDPNATRVAAGTGGSTQGAGTSTEEESASLGEKIKRVLLTGVSYMIPFVAGGGLLIALGFLLAGTDIANAGVADTILTENNLGNLPAEMGGHAPLLVYLGAVAFKIGALSMGFLVPALAGYIAYGIADRTGIAPGFTAGAVASFMGAGFIGGLVGGVLAGLVAYWLNSLSVPRWLRGLMPVVIIPLIASIIASGAMFLFLGGPIAALTEALNSWLSSMTGASAVVLGIILGLMMCFDLGGPVNKVAYSFAVAGLGAASVSNEGPWLIMAAVMGAGMVPPLGMALATFLARNLFTLPERENGKAAVLLGASFISEGAIPFAAADPLRVIPASMLGGAVTGALSMAFGVTSKAPHGGLFVGFAIDPVLAWSLAIVVGSVVTALSVIALKKWVGARQPEEAIA
ncbi:PTS fructose transporter subunit IIABC [Haematomicrobium sanguinis]|uniref:PTS fructose transporter subunit IIABC n=1 Tax=Haematomicrobium sanguinis TaxID=479106 RepID=UPI00047E7F34|nr:fructose-specific PTS transporter subunit EIIC [Haematomicrobium sanguinis]